MKKRTHKDTTRLTAKERAENIASLDSHAIHPWHRRQLVADIEKALQLHARETLERFKRRRGL